ncbi:hypothetical protein L596_012770 [Steinernema carpocapsae]|uniref:Uncharacterized protein n=1 Tax=Steinernema carpocapsae TaxID=34508 RepID=A0A4V6A4W7_STECR|nr:hypothetical protein L596_012770 [Steinernema carpocapsae]
MLQLLFSTTQFSMGKHFPVILTYLSIFSQRLTTTDCSTSRISRILPTILAITLRTGFRWCLVRTAFA